MQLHKVILPAMDEVNNEASIIRWLVGEGDTVNLDQPLVEIATDKIFTELNSPCEGIIKKIITQAGEIPKVGEVIVFIQTSEHDPDDENKQENTFSKVLKKPAKPLSKFDTKIKKRPFVPPTIRLSALKLRIELDHLIRFTQKAEGEIITRSDLEYYLKAQALNPENHSTII